MEGFFSIHRHIGLAIVNYLAPADYFALTCVFDAIVRQTPAIYPSTTDFLFRRIVLALERRLGRDIAATFARHLKRSILTPYLTGGFLLAILNGDLIRPEQDIDVLLIDNDDDELYLDLSPCFDNNEEMATEGDYSHVSLCVRTCMFRETLCKVQFITPSDSILTHLDGYDLSFCKNIANGRGFRIADPDGVVTRACAFSVLDYIIRYVSEDDSGFGLREDTRYRVLCAKVRDRLAKYRARGYDVRVVDNAPCDIIKCLSWPFGVTRRHEEIARLWGGLK
jgi:hypothetical protein